MPTKIHQLTIPKTDHIRQIIIDHIIPNDARDSKVYWTTTMLRSFFYKYTPHKDLTWRLSEFQFAMNKMVRQNFVKKHYLNYDIYYEFK